MASARNQYGEKRNAKVYEPCDYKHFIGVALVDRYKTLPVLVVDDEPFILNLLSHMLGQLGFEAILTAGSGEDALRILNTGEIPQLILLDINMPSIDGVEFIRSLVTLEYSGSLILVSGEAERALEAVMRLADARGINVLGYLQKPVAPEALEALLANLATRTLPLSHPSKEAAYGTDTLQAAITNGELINYFQPKVNVQTGAFEGAEVLVRWRHPTDGLVYPDQFIPLAEENGLIQALTMNVLLNTFRQVRVWLDSGLTVKTAINISMDDLNSLSFPDDLANMAEKSGVSTHDIVLEVTERQLIPNLVTVLDTLSRLHLKRIELAVDDFGTGYSSLAQLSDLPFDQLKIDKRFVHGASGNPTAQAIFVASSEMANQLDMEVVAEGVEDRADWDWLQKMGCDVAQGYFIARPMPAEALPEWLEKWQQRVQDECLLSKPTKTA
ncbi:Phytochrome-like protein cph2 [Halioglobus japonicus]|nr:Phytochrome-like protein cph2 [Halioglobus japonicus]